LKIVAVKCPSCEGSGKFMAERFSCLWCKGKKKLRERDALRYADQLVTLAVGGYVCGDLDWKDRKEMLVKADALCAAFKRPVFGAEYTR